MSRKSLINTTRLLRTSTPSPTRAFSTLRPLAAQAPATGPDEKIGAVHYDQTKKSNDPTADNTDQHKKNSESLYSREERNSSDLGPGREEVPDRSTGLKTEGPDGKAGTGKRDNVRQEKSAGENMAPFDHEKK